MIFKLIEMVDVLIAQELAMVIVKDHAKGLVKILVKGIVKVIAMVHVVGIVVIWVNFKMMWRYE